MLLSDMFEGKDPSEERLDESKFKFRNNLDFVPIAISCINSFTEQIEKDNGENVSAFFSAPDCLNELLCVLCDFYSLDVEYVYGGCEVNPETRKYQDYACARGLGKSIKRLVKAVCPWCENSEELNKKADQGDAVSRTVRARWENMRAMQEIEERNRPRNGGRSIETGESVR